MFFHRLTKEQRASFLALATKMLLADGKVAPEEAAFLETLRQEVGIDIRMPPHEIYGEVNIAPFDTRESQVVAALGLLVMAYVDGHFHVDETSVFHDVCKAFGLGSKDVARLKGWATRQTELLAEVDGFIAG